MATNNRRNRIEVPGAQSLLDKLKAEVAEELGIHNYEQLDKGDLPARVHGKIGGNMVRKLIEYAETHMVSDGEQAYQEIAKQQGPNEQDKESVAGYMQQYQATHPNEVSFTPMPETSTQDGPADQQLH